MAMNKPVAWIYQHPDTLQPALKFAEPTTYWATVISTPDIPLYTHPLDKLDKVLKHNERLLNALIDQRKFWEAEIEKKNTLLKMWETTHPVKELTDEEIDELHKLHTTLPPKPWKGVPLASFDVYGFARAILRKAQEK